MANVRPNSRVTPDLIRGLASSSTVEKAAGPRIKSGVTDRVGR